MARFDRLHVCRTMLEIGVVPIFNHPDPDVILQIMKACYAGGARHFELTNRGDRAHEIFNHLTRYAEKNLPDLILGAGTIMDAGTAALYLQLGANFIVSPCVHEDVARTCNRRKVAWIPGAGTPTEVSLAEELGAEIVKIFPADALGPAFLKSMKGPMPWTTAIITKGVQATEESMGEWLDAGADCLGLGAGMLPPKAVAEGRWDEVAATTERMISFVKRWCSTH